MSGRWPSLSFVILVAAWTAAGAFLAWGWSTPALDEIWRLHQELRAGRRAGLDPEEGARLERALRDHPRLAEDWLDGQSVGLLTAAEAGWLRTPGAVLLLAAGTAGGRRLALDVQVAGEWLPLEAELGCGAHRERLRIVRPGAVELALPAAGEAPCLCQLALRRPGGTAFEGPPGVRLLLPEDP